MKRAFAPGVSVVVVVSLLGLVPMVAAATSGMPSVGQITEYALTLVGLPYRARGSSPATGFDCSGFVRHVFAAVPGIELPRAAREMAGIGKRIARHELRPGDLVFYDTLGSPFSHVGIYIGDGRFIHAPSSGGRVRVADMEEAYWRRHYSGARRVLHDTEPTAAPDPRESAS